MQSADGKPRVVAVLEQAIELLAEEVAQAKVALRGADIDRLTARLAQIRVAADPEVPRALSETMRISKVIDPLWVLHQPAETTSKLLVLRHPGLGWLMFELPAPEAARLGHAMVSGQPPRAAGERPSASTLH